MLRFPHEELQELFDQASVVEAMLVAFEHMQVSFVSVTKTWRIADLDPVQGLLALQELCFALSNADAGLVFQEGAVGNLAGPKNLVPRTATRATSRLSTPGKRRKSV